MKNYLIISLLIDLLKCDTEKASTLAEKNEVSVRTIYRYLDYLECAGIPTITVMGKNGGVGIDKSFKLNTLVLTKDEKGYLKHLIEDNPSNLSEMLVKKLNL